MRTSARSMQYLRKTRKLEYVGLVERHTPRFMRGGAPVPGGGRHDLFGFIDIVALDEFRGILAVQACGTDVTAHLRKIEAEPAAVEWLTRLNRLEVHGWRKVRHGTKAWRWKPRIIHAIRKAHTDSECVTRAWIEWEEEPAS